MILNSFLFYFIFASAVLIYGIGINSNAEVTYSRKNLLPVIIKSYVCVISTVVFSFLINKFLLLPVGLIELYPMFALLVFMALSVFIEILIQVTAKKSASEFAIAFLCVVLALNEGITLVDAIIIAFSCLTSFYLLIPFLYAILRRIDSVKNLDAYSQKCSMFFIMVVFILALYSLNISWFNMGLLR